MTSETSLLDTILETKAVRTRDGRTLPLHSNVDREEAELLARLVREYRCVRTLEVGLAYGVSALAICGASRSVSPEARHVAIDPMQNDPSQAWAGVGVANLEEAGYSGMVEFVEEPSHLAMPTLERRGDRFDLAFVDGWHTFDHTMIDLFLCDRVLRPGGILAVDDADMPPVRKACRYLVANRGYEVVAHAGPDEGVGLKRRLLARLAAVGPIGRILAPEAKASDASMGLIGELIAFRKGGDDVRKWDAHREF